MFAENANVCFRPASESVRPLRNGGHCPAPGLLPPWLVGLLLPAVFSLFTAIATISQANKCPSLNRHSLWASVSSLPQPQITTKLKTVFLLPRVQPVTKKDPANDFTTVSLPYLPPLHSLGGNASSATYLLSPGLTTALQKS